MSKTLLIATWGSPQTWRDVDYTVNSKRYRTCVTTIPLVESLESKNSRELDVAIIVLDSLIAAGGSKRREGKCYKCFELHRDKLKAQVDDYNGILSSVESFTRSFIECVSEGTLERGRVEVVVAPASGSFGGWLFMGGAFNYSSVVLAGLADKLGSNAYSEVVLDFSHGVNYMPSQLAYIRDMIAGLQLAGGIDNVTIRAYNSDPVVDGVKEARINVIFEERVGEIRIPRIWGGRGPIKPVEKGEPPERVSRLIQEANRLKKSVEAVTTSIYYPLPVALNDLCNDKEVRSKIEELDNRLEGALRDLVEVDPVSSKVRWLTEVNPEWVYAVKLSKTICEWWNNHYRGEFRIRNWKEFLNKFYKKLSSLHYAIISNELSRVEERVKGFWNQMGEGVYLLYEVLGEKGECRQPDKRIMIAHAGLQKELVLVKNLRGETTLTYKLENGERDEIVGRYRLKGECTKYIGNLDKILESLKPG